MIFFKKLFLTLLVSFLGCTMLFAESSQTTEHPKVILETTLGEITLELYPDKAPLTVANFLRYVDEDYYKGTLFHRVIAGFMIQGGGFDEHWQQRPTQTPIKNEANNGLKNVQGTVAMARTSEVDSATSQFFINLVDNPALDHGVNGFGYAVFGKVVAGMDSVESIGRSPTTAHYPHQDVPRQLLVIKNVRRI